MEVEKLEEEQIEQIESKQFELVDGVQATIAIISYESNGWKLKRYVWENASNEELQYGIGDRVWPAGESFKDFFSVKQIFQPGVRFYPEGGVVCFNSSGAQRSFNLDAIIKHPGVQELEEKQIKKRRKK